MTPVPGTEDAETVFVTPGLPPNPAPPDVTVVVDTTGLPASAVDTTGLPASAGGVRHVTAPKAANGPLSVGQQFSSRYTILKLLGIGGMGAVYQAWDAELSVAVALKVIRPEAAQDHAAAQDIERRFKQELLLARQVTHKNVVRIHDLGEIDGIKYITMPYIEGSDLATVLRDSARLPIPQVMAIARQVAAGLQAAHEAGVVHRDLKPANVMLEKDHEAVIMDFGIARSTSRVGSAPARPAAPTEPLSVDDALTRAAATVVGAVIGTIEYMAPEQARGEHVDQRADVYAFGLIVYDLLVGRRRVDHAPSAVFELQKRMGQTPPSVKSVVPEVPDALDKLVTKCTEPEADKRYQTTAELVAALDLLDDSGKLKPKKRVVGLPLVAAVVTLLLAVSVGVWWYQRQFIPPAAHDPVSVVIADFVNSTGDTAFDSTLEPVMKVALEGATFITSYDRAGIRRSFGVAPPEILDERTAMELAVQQGVDIVLSGTVSRESRGYGLSVKAIRAATGEVIASADDRTPSKDRVLAVSSALATEVRKALGDDTSDDAQRFAMASWTATSLDVVHQYALAVVAISDANYELARQAFLEAIRLDPKFGSAYMGLAVTYQALGQNQDAVKYATDAMRLVDGMTERERFQARGTFYSLTYDNVSCVKEFEVLIARFAQDVTAHNQFALCSSRLRNMTKAIDEMQRVVTILPKRALYRVNLSLYAAYGSNYQLAEQEARTAIDMKSRWGWLALAFAQLGQGQTSQTTESYEALARVDAFGVSQSASGLGDLAIYEGRYSEGVRILQAGATADIETKNPDRAAAKLVALANAQILRSDKRAATAAAERALMNSSAVKIRFMAARVFIEAGEGAKAESLRAGLAKEPLAEPRAYARILEGESLLLKGDPTQAIASLNAANELLDTWIGHYDLGRAFLEAGRIAQGSGQVAQAIGLFTQADSELDKCIRRRGEAISLFLDEEPTYGSFPSVHYYQGLAREGFGTAGFAESYRAYLNIRGNSTEDALVRDARRRIGA